MLVYNHNPRLLTTLKMMPKQNSRDNGSLYSIQTQVTKYSTRNAQHKDPDDLTHYVKVKTDVSRDLNPMSWSQAAI
jgi:hypothetical protein